MESIPDTLVLPSAYYQHCVGFLLCELFDEAALRTEAPPPLPAPPGSAAKVGKAMKEALKIPFWERRFYVQHFWDEELRVLVRQHLVELWQQAPAQAAYRLETKSADHWFVRLPPSEKQSDPESEETCEVLMQTYEFCEWQACGGNADVGRWLARCSDLL